MKIRYVLVDFENVKPANLEMLRGDAFKVRLFIGAKQKIPEDTKKALQSLGANAETIHISGTGKNALDFHIAFYIGQIAAQFKDVLFYIVSKDKGFDPLIKHLQLHKTNCSRVSSLDKIVPTQPTSKTETTVARAISATKPTATKAILKKKPVTTKQAPATKPAATRAVPQKKSTPAKPTPKAMPVATKAIPKKKPTAAKPVPKPRPTVARALRTNPGVQISIAALTDKVIAGLGAGRRPGLLENLESAIKDLLMDLFNEPISSGRVAAIIEEMKSRRLIKVVDGIVSHNVPNG